MKKILWIIIWFLLIVGGWFLYLVKNPTLPLAQKILPTLGIHIETLATIDLTNCVHYFDGCNTCSVVSWTIDECTMRYCEEPRQPSCLEYAEPDLTNCTSYFDGCNNCSVSGGMIGWCTKKYCEVLEEPKCLAYIPSNDLTQCKKYFDGCNTCEVEDGQITSCTEKRCTVLKEPKCLEMNQWEQSPIDLTNCISYFDGCNNCSVKDGKPDACTLMYCEHPSQPKCNQYASDIQDQPQQNPSVGIANPASVYCENHGGTLEILTDANGGQFGMCYLPDGTNCEERAYMRGECWPDTNSDFEEWVTPGDDWEATVCTMEYAPVCASVQVQCIKAPCPPVEQTFGNKCMMNANKLATFLHDGECTTK